MVSAYCMLRVSARVARGAARNAGAVFAEAVPWVGAAAVIGFTALDLRDACATMEDLAALDEAAGPDPEPPAGAPAGARAGDASLLDRATAEVCALELPTLADLRAGPAPSAPDAPSGPAHP